LTCRCEAYPDDPKTTSSQDSQDFLSNKMKMKTDPIRATCTCNLALYLTCSRDDEFEGTGDSPLETTDKKADLTLAREEMF